MKIKFTGIIESRAKGCGACGKHHADRTFRTLKTYILPSGIIKTFFAGRVEEVSDGDGQFLLQFKYTTPQGEVKNVFEAV